ncbi:polysaccharide biosynthesis/export family protein [Labrys okinawensis]|uniref:polysaccharide biosynthesis/export family protein n=1 Tax=Labrys okinawensis TaxID=346911 RepID=UPI0039BCFAAA
MRVHAPIASLFLISLLASCSTLPHAGPTANSIVSGSEQARDTSGATRSRYAVYDIDERIVSAIENRKPTGFHGSFRLRGPAPSGTLGIGDIVSVSVYEASSGGLFGTGDVGTGVGTKSAQIPPQQIGHDGRINVPFAGTVRAAGLTPDQVSRAITSALSPKAIEPQVVVSLVQNMSSTVSVAGEVGQGGRFPLSLRGDKVLDAIAEAGGPKTSSQDIYVRMIRGKSSAVVPMSVLLSNPDENVYLRAGDQIFLYQDPKSFTVLGASGRNSNIDFESKRVTLAEAIGKAGGLDDQRSDATGVFIFRYEDACVYADFLGKKCADVGGRVPLVYRLNLIDPNSLLIAQRFFMHDKDVIFVSSSPSTELYKFLQLIGTGVGMVGTGANIASIAK